MEGIPPEAPADPDEVLDAVELDDDELDEDELDDDELDEDELDEDELELEDEGMDGIDAEGMDGICGMLDCVCWVVSHALSKAHARLMDITRRCCNSFIFTLSICPGQIDVHV